jgi:hypothetical protein
MSAQTFWWIMTLACIVWFSTITVYVAIRGGIDIKHMLRRLKPDGEQREE